MADSPMEPQQKEKRAYNQTTAKRRVGLATGVDWQGQGSLHLLCALFWECWPLHSAWKIITISEFYAHSGLQIIRLRTREKPCKKAEQYSDLSFQNFNRMSEDDVLRFEE